MSLIIMYLSGLLTGAVYAELIRVLLRRRHSPTAACGYGCELDRTQLDAERRGDEFAAKIIERMNQGK